MRMGFQDTSSRKSSHADPVGNSGRSLGWLGNRRDSEQARFILISGAVSWSFLYRGVGPT
jgi:hypothetical protein